MKKLLAILLSLVMVLAMVTTVLATELDPGETTEPTPTPAPTPAPGSITINNVVAGHTYTIYRVFDLVVNDETNPSAYRYTLNDAWKGNTDKGLESLDKYTGASTYFVLEGPDEHIVWKTDMNNEAGAKGFAELLEGYLARAKELGVTITPTASKKVEEEDIAENGSYTFNSLDLGYYFIKSTVGFVLALDTTNPDATFDDKNGAPTVDKQVQEGSNWGKVNDANIGDIIHFKTIITAQEGAQSYVLHDRLTNMGFVNIQANITEPLPTDSPQMLDGYYATVTKTSANEDGTSITTTTILTYNTDYEVKTTGLPAECPVDGPNAAPCSFHVEFKPSFLEDLKDGDKITFYYSATLRSSAVVGGAGNPNETWLDYGVGGHTTHDTTKTYTWEISILKYTGSETNVLSGAEFILYKGDPGAEQYANFDSIPAVTNAEGQTTPAYYRLTGYTKNEDDATTLISGSDGIILLKGLDAGTYSLKETKAPAGYNLLAAPTTITIDPQEVPQTDPTSLELTPINIKVENQTGSELPSTGGIGTKVFYIVGGVLVLAAVVFFIVRRRMNAGNANAE